MAATMIAGPGGHGRRFVEPAAVEGAALDGCVRLGEGVGLGERLGEGDGVALAVLDVAGGSTRNVRLAHALPEHARTVCRPMVMSRGTTSLRRNSPHGASSTVLRLPRANTSTPPGRKSRPCS